MKNDTLYEEALKAINKLFNDQSVTAYDAIQNLENLQEEINLLIETLESQGFPE